MTTSLPTYFYDAGGRLSSVLNASGGTANYAYDSAGNILSVTQNASSTLQLLQVCPNAAPASASVTIWGTAFTASSTVTFNGTASPTVNFVSANEIIATVPAIAGLSGPVVVHGSGSSKATSPSTFQVGPLPPQIGGITGGTTIGSYLAADPFPFYGAYYGGSGSSPTGLLGNGSTQSLTISGSGFDATTPLTSNLNKVWVGTRAAQVTAASATSLTVQVPAGGSVQKSNSPPVVTVTAPNGTSTYSAQTLLVTPAGVSPYLMNQRAPGPKPTSVLLGVDATLIDAATDTLTIGGAAQTLTFGSPSTAQHFVAFMFAGAGGSTINAGVSVCPPAAARCGPGGTTGSTGGAVFLVAPDGNQVDAADLGGTFPPVGVQATQEFWKLPQTGTYTLYVQNQLALAGATAIASVNTVAATQNLGSFSVGSSPSGTVSGFAAAAFTFSVPQGSTGRATLKTTLTNYQGSPFFVAVTAPDGATQIYNSGRIPEGDSGGFLAPGQVDFSGPLSIPYTSAGGTYTVFYQSLSPSSSAVTFNLVALANDVQVTCSGFPSNGASETCSGTITAPGQAIYANLGTNPNTAPIVAALITSKSTFSGCFEVILADTALQQDVYRAVQCGQSDYSYPLQFPTGSVGPYVARAFGLSQNTGGLQFALSAGSPLSSVITTIGDQSPPTTNFSFAGQSQAISLGGNASMPGAWVSLNTSQPPPPNWTECFLVSITAHARATAPFATYLQCPTPGTTPTSSLQLPATGKASNYTITVTPLGGQSGSITTSVTSVASPSGIPINGSIYGLAPASDTTYSAAFTSPATANQYLDLVTVPTITGTQKSATQSCYETKLNQNGQSAPLFDSINQFAGFQVTTNAQCSDLEVSTASPAAASTAGTATLNVNNATAFASSSYSQTLYDYTAVTAAGTLSLPASGPAGVTLASTLPGQPAFATFTSSTSNNFVQVVIGMDANLAEYCSKIIITDLNTGTRDDTLATCSMTFWSGGIALETPGDTYQIAVYPQGDSVGNISIGVGAQ